MVEARAQRDLAALQRSDLARRLADEGKLVASWDVDPIDLPMQLARSEGIEGKRVLEHPRLPFVSYPYEWPFELLKRAALLHLDLHLELLKSGFTLIDASAYNVQFVGTRPIFIDLLSIRTYRDGEYWAGYRQYCEQFLNPLLLTAKRGVPFQAWYRGHGEGISVSEIAGLLPLRSRLSPALLLHVHLHARLVDRSEHVTAAQRSPRRPMPKASLVWMLGHLRACIAGLEVPVSRTTWGGYAGAAPYSAEAGERKHAFVRHYIESARPRCVLDLGCNAGDYGATALDAGAEFVIGTDMDQGALGAAIRAADARGLKLLPLVLDVLDPSPGQGWAQSERSAFRDRLDAQGLLALALLHHIVIGRNVPLASAVSWLVALAPGGVIEFVPKSDPMVQGMLATREDIFADYTLEAFTQCLQSAADIARTERISETGRTLFQFQRR